MKPMIFVPPAQAEALSDTQDNLCSVVLSIRQPWRDDEGVEETLSSSPPHVQRLEASASKIPVSKAQHWPSSVNISR